MPSGELQIIRYYGSAVGALYVYPFGGRFSLYAEANKGPLRRPIALEGDERAGLFNEVATYLNSIGYEVSQC